MIMVRYADDTVVGFQHESDARRFRDAMRDRLREFSLSLHPEKTRLIEFGRFAAQNCNRRGRSKPIFQKANFYPEKYSRETFLADAGQRSRAIIPATTRETSSRPSGAASIPTLMRSG